MVVIVGSSQHPIRLNTVISTSSTRIASRNTG